MRSLFLLFAFFLSLCLGCSGKSSVTGTVNFEDGSPLTKGEVFFESDAGFLGSGKIRSDGAYTVGSEKESDGLPDGTYMVTVRGAFDMPPVPPDADMSKPETLPKATQLVDTKFASNATSGLTCEVKGKTVYPITVTPPAK